MNLKAGITSYFPIIRASLRHPKLFRRFLRDSAPAMQGYAFARDWTASATRTVLPDASANPLRDYVNSLTDKNRGIVKWDHYFDIYHRHFSKFRGQEVHILEIGLFGGGSLDMWKSYFGPGCRIYGVDLEEACMGYEDSQTRIFIGDQEDRSFWKHFKREVPRIDILIDDGGHMAAQQIVTLEEMLPHISPGGVFFCEDIADLHQGFQSYVNGLSDFLNAYDENNRAVPNQNTVFCHPLQRDIGSIHRYPMVTVIEKAMDPMETLRTVPRGNLDVTFDISKNHKRGR